MINYISKVTIYVQNQDEAMAFWTEKMGFDCDIKPMGPDFKWVEVKPQTDSLTSFVIYEKALMKSQNPQTNVEHPSIILSTQDIQVTYEEMKEKGIKVDDLKIMPDGKMFTFYDQDENRYMIREDK